MNKPFTEEILRDGLISYLQEKEYKVNEARLGDAVRELFASIDHFENKKLTVGVIYQNFCNKCRKVVPASDMRVGKNCKDCKKKYVKEYNQKWQATSQRKVGRPRKDEEDEALEYYRDSGSSSSDSNTDISSGSDSDSDSSSSSSSSSSDSSSSSSSESDSDSDSD